MMPKRFQFPAFLRAIFLILSAVVLVAVLCLPALISCLVDPSGRWPSFFQKLWVRGLLSVNRIPLRVRAVRKLDEGQS